MSSPPGDRSATSTPISRSGVELKRRGYAARIATLEAWRDNVERAGSSSRPAPGCATGEREARELIRRVLDAREGPEYLFKKVFAPHMRETYDDTRAAVKGPTCSCHIRSRHRADRRGADGNQMGVGHAAADGIPVRLRSADAAAGPGPAAPRGAASVDRAVLIRLARWHMSVVGRAGLSPA